MEENFVCENCNEQCDSVTTAYMDGDNVDICDNCVDEDFTMCADCNDYHRDNDLSENKNGDLICQGCIDEGYVICSDCDAITPHNEVTSVCGGSEVVCDTCLDENYTHCDGCGDHESDGRYLERYDEWICDDCISDRYFWCDSCDQYVHSDDYDGNNCCCNCSDENCGSQVGINGYGYKPSPNFHLHKTEDKQNSPLYLGIELEVENKNGTDSQRGEQVTFMEHFQKKQNFIYLKEDGSLTDGFECVSYPATLDYHTRVFDWKKLTKQLSYLGYRSYSTENCGIHIHINRGFLSAVEQKKLHYFVIHQAINIKKIAQRDSHWARYNTKNKFKEYGEPGGRDALNFNNRHTIEFRIFKGTLKYSTLRSYMEFVESITRFIKSAQFPIEQLSNENGWASYMNFVSKDKKYKVLQKYLTDKGFTHLVSQKESVSKVKKVKKEMENYYKGASESSPIRTTEKGGQSRLAI